MTRQPFQQSSQTKIALIANNIENIKDDVSDIKKQLEGNYVTKDEFGPVRNIVYGLVGLILIAIVGALMTLLLRK